MSLSHGKSYQVYCALPVSMQNLAVTAFGSIRWLHEQCGTFQNRVSRLMKMQRFEPEEIEAHRRDSLTGILLAAKNTDFYRDQLPGRQAILEDPLGTLARIPVLGRECVRSNPTRVPEQNLQQTTDPPRNERNHRNAAAGLLDC